MNPGHHMQFEMNEQPERLAALIARRPALERSLAPLFEGAMAGTVVVARGSSDHAATCGRYLLEMATGRPVASASPSVHLLYGAEVDFSGYVVIAVSQSGRTPEIASVLRKASSSGARTIAVTNDADSPLAEVADAVVALDAGSEKAVPATKTVTAEIVAFALISEIAGAARTTGSARPAQPGIGAADWEALPGQVGALLDDAGVMNDLATWLLGRDRMATVARGLLYGAAAECALKLEETTSMLATAFSAADLRHGPIAIASSGIPVLTMAHAGPAAEDVLDLVGELRSRGAEVRLLGPVSGADAGWAQCPEALAPVLAVVRAQQLALALTLAMGRDTGRATRADQDHHHVTTGARVLLTGCTLATPAGMAGSGEVLLEDGLVSRIGPSEQAGGPAADRVVHLAGRVVAAGFIDVHVHGGGGAQFSGDSEDEVTEAAYAVARLHARHGTTSLLATTVSESPERLRKAMRGLAAAIASPREDGARIEGIHLEGPFLAASKVGAQDPEAVRLPDPAELASLQEISGGAIRMVTLAPELPGAIDLVREALALGIRASVGHTAATYEQVQAAFEAGASHATHLFNAMAPLHHRRPGPVAAALLDDRVTLELIADLEHVHPAVLDLVGRVAGERVCLVSDGVAAIGLDDGGYRLGRLGVELQGSRVFVAGHPETLAGSVLTIERAVANMLSSTRLQPRGVLAAAAATPARAAGLERRGELAPGLPADLVILEPDWSVAATLVGGRPVWDPAGLFAG